MRPFVFMLGVSAFTPFLDASSIIDRNKIIGRYNNTVDSADVGESGNNRVTLDNEILGPKGLSNSSTLGNATRTIVAKTSIPTVGPTIVPVGYGMAYLGCFLDSAHNRLLTDLFHTSDHMTVEWCTNHCLKYAGVEYGKECHCGYNFPNGTTLLSDDKCNMLCTGDSSELCGGNLAMMVYESG